MKKYIIMLLLGILSVSCGNKGNNQKKTEENNNIDITANSNQNQNIQNTQGGWHKFELNDTPQTSENSGQKIFGNAKIGYITLPAGWNVVGGEGSNIEDGTSGNNGKIFAEAYFQEEEGNTNYIPLSSYSTDNYPNAYSMAKQLYTSLKQMSDENEGVITETTINGYRAYQVVVKKDYISNNARVIHYLDFRGRIYSISIDGRKDNIKSLIEMVNKSWTPERSQI